MIFLADYLFFWWIAIPVAAIFFMATIEYGKSVLATFVFFVILGLFQVFTDVKPLQYIMHNPLESAVIAALYVGIGVVYVWFKWWSFCGDIVRALKSDLERLPQLGKNWKDGTYYVKSNGYNYKLKDGRIPVNEHKARIFGWIFYWPTSAAWTLVNDPIRRLFNFIYDRISGGLQKIADAAMAKVG